MNTEIRDKIEETIFQALGTASMQWSEIPKGTYESTAAMELGNEVIAKILTLFPQWQTFSETCKPEEGQENVAVRDSEGIFFDVYDWQIRKHREDIVNDFIDKNYQWYPIPND